VIIRNTKPRLMGVSKVTRTKPDGTVAAAGEKPNKANRERWPVHIESYEFQPGNNVVDLDRGRWLASIPIFKTMLENGNLVVVSKGGTSEKELREGLKGIFSVAALEQLRKDPQYASMGDEISARVRELVAPAVKE
jgi:hypothetical protein